MFIIDNIIFELVIAMQTNECTPNMFVCLFVCFLFFFTDFNEIFAKCVFSVTSTVMEYILEEKAYLAQVFNPLMPRIIFISAGFAEVSTWGSYYQKYLETKK